MFLQHEQQTLPESKAESTSTQTMETVVNVTTDNLLQGYTPTDDQANKMTCGLTPFATTIIIIIIITASH